MPGKGRVRASPAQPRQLASARPFAPRTRHTCCPLIPLGFLVRSGDLWHRSVAQLQTLVPDFRTAACSRSMPGPCGLYTVNVNPRPCLWPKMAAASFSAAPAVSSALATFLRSEWKSARAVDPGPLLPAREPLA